MSVIPSRASTLYGVVHTAHSPHEIVDVHPCGRGSLWADQKFDVYRWVLYELKPAHHKRSALSNNVDVQHWLVTSVIAFFDGLYGLAAHQAGVTFYCYHGTGWSNDFLLEEVPGPSLEGGCDELLEFRFA